MYNTLNELTKWFAMQCDGDWEHNDGITIESLDNPGWLITISVEGTLLENAKFDAVKSGNPDDSDDDSWIECYKQGTVFTAMCGKIMLEAALNVFLDWMHSNTNTTPWDTAVERLKQCCLSMSIESDIQAKRRLFEEIESIPNEHPEKPMLKRMFRSIWPSGNYR